VNGEMHFANASEPSVPAAIQRMVLGLQGLHDFQARHTTVGPLITNGNTHTLGPGDLAIIYDINPLYRVGIDGSGQKIAVIARSDLQLSDVRQFRSMCGLPAKDPQLVLVPGSADPGMPGGNAESNLDVEWSGSIAPNAQVVYVYATTEMDLGKLCHRSKSGSGNQHEHLRL
jgi:subtilase family serine protease